MPIDLKIFSDKLDRYCKQFEVTYDELSRETDISLDRLKSFQSREKEPTGDEILILADFFKCDFKFFISNEKLASFEQTEALFRKQGDILSRADRWAIQEFLFLCECQEYLLSNMRDKRLRPFKFKKKGTFFKQHGKDAAASLLIHLAYQANQAPKDIFQDLRKIGIHIFRRKLEQSAISGLFLRHPVAGLCVLVNFNEDLYRQRFTAAHEAAHAILDEDDFTVSLLNWDRGDLSEVRANTFASNLLLPPAFLKAIPDATIWNQDKVLEWSKRLMVNVEPLLYALRDAELIDDNQVASLKDFKIPRDQKIDSELAQNLSLRTRERKLGLLQMGLSDSYVNLCFEGYENGLITQGRLAEMLLVHEGDISEIAVLYGMRLAHVD